MEDKQSGLDKRLRTYGASSLLTLAFGVGFSFFALMIANFQGFFVLSVVSLLLIIAAGVLGMYCWRLVYLSYRGEVSWVSFALGTFACIVPFIVVHEVLTKQ